MAVTLIDRLPTGGRARIWFFLYLPLLFITKCLGHFEIVRNIMQRFFKEPLTKYKSCEWIHLVYVAKIMSMDYTRTLSQGQMFMNLPIYTLEGVSKFNELVIKYGNKVNFLTIYIREAHASDGEWPDTRTYSIKNHMTLNDRLVAANGLQDFGLAGQLMVDSMDDLSLLHYGALPERLCVIGADGSVLYLGGMGPWGYSLDELERVLRSLSC